MQNDAIPVDLTPGADETITGLDEVNRALELRTPNAICDLVFGFVYLHKATRRKNRMHGEVFRSYVSIGISAVGKRRKIGEGNHAPLLDHACNVRRLGKCERWIQPDRNTGCRRTIRGLRKMGTIGPRGWKIGMNPVKIDAIPCQQLTVIGAIDRRQGVETEDAGNDAFRLVIAKSALNLQTTGFYVPHGVAERFS